MTEYRPDAVKAKVRKGGWDSLSQAEKMDWHGDVYGWRRARLGVPADVRTSPADPDGQWFDEKRADYAENHYREKAKGQQERVQDANREKPTQQQRVSDMRPAELAAQAQAVKDQWARDHGYLDCADYQEREGLDYVDAASNISRSIIAAGAAAKKAAFDDPPDADPHALLKALGVTAKEERVYSAEELRRGRVALGLEKEPIPPAQAAE